MILQIDFNKNVFRIKTDVFWKPCPGDSKDTPREFDKPVHTYALT